MAEQERPDRRVNQGVKQGDVERLQQRLLDAVNDPVTPWSEQPMIAVGTFAGVTANMMREIVRVDPSQLSAIRNLLVSMADLVAEAVKPAPTRPAGPVGKWH